MQATALTTGSVARDLGRVMKTVMTSTNRDFFSALDKAGLSFTQVKSLSLLTDADALSVSAIAEELVMSLAATSRALDALVESGHVTREEDERDRRSRLVSITPQGRRTFERLVAVRRAGIERLLAELEPAELESLAAALAPIAERLGR